jgi:hypothetical protein
MVYNIKILLRSTNVMAWNMQWEIVYDSMHCDELCINRCVCAI